MRLVKDDQPLFKLLSGKRVIKEKQRIPKLAFELYEYFSEDLS
jgi:hypothetical protein